MTDDGGEARAARVLLVDDDADLCRDVAAGLERRGFTLACAGSAADAVAVLEHDDIDAVIADVALADGSGIALCARIASDRPDVPVAMLTGAEDVTTAIDALRAGAADLFVKPPDVERIADRLLRVVERRRLRDELRRLPTTAAAARTESAIVGGSPGMRRLVERLGRAAGSDASVLVTGESGTGKELIARALHERSGRRNGPFVAVNCAVIPAPLLESELFGHVRGAFTDARTARPGLFVRAVGGTLFLDEIGEMPLALQPKLLRVLQERVVRPVGGEVEVPCDVRLVAATNCDLEAAVREHRFREDLYFRIDVLRLDVPPLRARGRDVLLLAQHFLDYYAAAMRRPVVGWTTAAAERLLAHGWPGNVRELRHCVEQSVALARHDRIGVEDLTHALHGGAPKGAAGSDPLALAPLDEVEHQHVLRVLAALRGNRTLAARTLGVDRKTLYRKLLRWSRAEA
jgi:DNA-binding NtrC family response regulator